MTTAQLELIHTEQPDPPAAGPEHTSGRRSRRSSTRAGRTAHNWKLDRRTVEIGRAGVAQARAALAAATARNLDPETDGPFDSGTEHRAAA
jgi:hypothetical protein